MVNLSRVAMAAVRSKYTIRSLPAAVKGMTVFDENSFVTEVPLPFVPVKCEMISTFKKVFDKYLVKMPNFLFVQAPENDVDISTKIKNVLLDPNCIQSFEDLSASELVTMKEHFADSLQFKTVTLGYNNWSAPELLDAVLEKDKSLSAFSIVGDILHVNLKDFHLPQKEVIGQILLRRTKGIKTVINKVGIIDNTYRNFSMEVLAGETRDNYVVEVKTNGITFNFDFVKVYWNPRLSTEHERVVELLSTNDVLLDVFAGVGPFSVPAAKHKKVEKVYANDLNPDSHKWLAHNVKRNKVTDRVETYSLDGRDFIRTVAKKVLAEMFKSGDSERSAHFVMNLPALAIEFLDAFVGLMERECVGESGKTPSVWVHVYGFSKDEGDKKSDIAKRCVDVLGGAEPLEMSVSFVRNVAPKKDMMRASFRLTNEILVAKDDAQQECKKRKVE
jgi:tRNA (guanine37-N1)-methyltransferase